MTRCLAWWYNDMVFGVVVQCQWHGVWRGGTMTRCLAWWYNGMVFGVVVQWHDDDSALEYMLPRRNEPVQR